ncbi:MAG: hypothetical protein JWO14_2710, partial [Solirubrobacterales bacterium]|nr:hypothetical protein [Solirubrobacterales bacterium]
RPEGVAAPRRAVEDAAGRGEGQPERASVAGHGALTVEQVDVDQEGAAGDHLAGTAATRQQARAAAARADRGADDAHGGDGGGAGQNPAGNSGDGDRGGLHLAAQHRGRGRGRRLGKPADRVDGVLGGGVFLGDDFPIKVVVAH